MQLYNQIQSAVAYINKQIDFQPEFGIILGTGLSNLAQQLKVEQVIPYDEIPYFPIPTVQSHKGELVFGTWEGMKVVAMAGRFHYYEGYTMKEVTFPVRVLKFLGIRMLVISNAAGSTNAEINAGDLVFIRDHINLHNDNPLIGVNDERLGPRFPDMVDTYNPDLNQKALSLAKSLEIPAHLGVYAGLPGPNIETPAEYEFLNRIGGDVVGMSTIPEVLVAKHMELPVFVVSVATNKCYPIESIQKVTIEEVIAVARSIEPKLSLLIKKLLLDIQN